MTTTETRKERDKYLKNEKTHDALVIAKDDRYEGGGTKVAFCYVPGDGLYAKDKTWTRPAEAKTAAWSALRRSPKLGQWLTNNPLSVLYGILDNDTILVTGLVAGGEWVPEPEARVMTPHLHWVEEPIVSAK